MADPAMMPLINYIRNFGEAGSTDVFNGITYWTDDQLEEILNSVAVQDTVRLDRVSQLNPRSMGFAKKHYKPRADFTLWTCQGQVVVGYTYNEHSNTVLLDANPPSSEILYAEGQFHNMNDALAVLWDRKASQRYDYIDFKGGHNTMYMEQQYKHCITKRDYYRSRTVRTFRRGYP